MDNANYYSTSIDIPPTGIVEFLPGGRAAGIDGDSSLLALARKAGVDIASPCNGGGTCGKCRVRVIEGQAPPPGTKERSLLSEEDISRGVRLACYIRPEGPMRIGLLSTAETGHRIESGGITSLGAAFVPGEGLVKKTLLHVARPSLHDSRSDMERVSAAAGLPLSPQFMPGLLQDVAQAAQEAGRAQGTVLMENISTSADTPAAPHPPAPLPMTASVLNGEIVGIEAGDTRGRLYGAAVDIGTTTVVASIVDMNTGREIGSAAAPNAQRGYGDDVISRLLFASESKVNQELLRTLILSQIDSLLAEACAAATPDPAAASGIAASDASGCVAVTASGIPAIPGPAAPVSASEISALVIAANTSMLHLLLGVDGRPITVAPFAPPFLSLPPLPAHGIGIASCPRAALALMPSISSYVGGDITAGVLATGMADTDETAMLIDIGTNGEIILGSARGFSACSCAAGPALEGMNIACGMIASAGAIESVSAEGGAIAIKTIDGAPPVGICGSGVVDAVATLVEIGAVGPTGRFAGPQEFADGTPLAPYRARFDAANKRFLLSGAIDGEPASRRPDAGESASSGAQETHAENGNGVNASGFTGEPASSDAQDAHTEGGGAPGVHILQKDVRQVQLAKAAIAAAIEILLDETGIRADEIGCVYIAGGFGKRLRLGSLVRIGLIPEAFADKVVFAGNTSKSGAALALLSPGAIAKAEALRGVTRYHELSVHPRYDGLFVKHMHFPVGS